MFKSSFSKYLTAFVVIILVSFLMLSGIITSMIRSHITVDKEEKMQKTCTIISKMFTDAGYSDIKEYIFLSDKTIETLMSLSKNIYDFNLLITNDKGDVLISTIDDANNKSSDTMGTPQNIPIHLFTKTTNSSGDEFGVYRGDEMFDEESHVYGKEIKSNDVTIGYVIVASSTEREDAFISLTRKTVINGSIWVMLAAVIAAYFITERIVHPMKNMTRAAKKFAKGDFSERLVVSGHDEVSELALAFNNMAESLENLESMRNSFLANVSHDLRTPMTTISGFIDGIISGAIPPDQHEHYLGVISSEVHRLSRLVSQLLDISRLESGDRKFTFTDFDVAEVSRLILLSFEQKINEKDLDVEFESDEDAMPVIADKDAIYQVIYNLCHNAIKFSAVKGKFSIKISKIENKKICIAIFDQGQAIPEEDAKRIFDRFYKTDKSRGLDKSGVGLGLYICKTIIDAHGETIELIPHIDGCEFRFTLKQGDPIVKHKS